MKKTIMILAAMALVLGLPQCKKQTSGVKEGNVEITLDVSANKGSRIDVNTATGDVAFEYGDVVYVGSGGKFVGTLTCRGTSFKGQITDATLGEPLYFFFLGNKTPAETLTAGTSELCSVVISDQTSNKLPVISFATSDQNFTGQGSYTAFFLNKAALVKFDVTSVSDSATCLKGMNNKVTINFTNNSFDYSQEGEGVITLPAGNGEHWAILLPQAAMEAGEAGSVWSADDCYIGIRGAIPAIYENGYLFSGIEVAVDRLPPDIRGKFTINGSGNQVYFSKGNLQYQASTNTWRFAEHQWDYVGYENANVSSTYDGWIDLFGWGTSGYDHGAVCYQPWSTSETNSDYKAYGQVPYNLNDSTGKADWGYNTISNGGNIENYGWRTLTNDEWVYVFNTRTASTVNGVDNARYAKAKVANVKGILLFPDSYTHPEAVAQQPVSINQPNNNTGWDENNYSADDFALMQNKGAVFLPAAGYRMGSEVLECGRQIFYWSASYCNYNMHFAHNVCTEADGKFHPGESYPRYFGESVRLVCHAE